MASLVKDSTGLRTEEGKWQCEGGRIAKFL